ncbi:MAG TPA: RNA 2',3'-cyclic phosphodiesterase [Solirubrobacteraceae bacterium]|nr:RNA 2',3'-cyclic phosphodiesterase [Solirubrobacteraceae bacterium]
MSADADRGRLFVAASLPEAVRAELARWARVAVVGRFGVRRLDPQTLHLTLCFLGDQPLSCVSELAGVLGAAAEAVAAIGQLAVGAPAWLPVRRPRALAVEIGDPDGTLRSLQRLLATDIAATIDWQAGAQRFRPHVTVARMRPGSERAGELVPTPQLSFACEKVVLLRSHLDSDGARYEELASVGEW